MGYLKRAQAFFAKFSNDWCMNLAGLLAYNFLTTIFPLLLAILALGALILPDSIIHPMADKLNTLIPAGAANGGAGGLNINFYDILERFRHASGITLVISLVGLLWTGTSLFGVMENCFSLIFRTRDRDFIHQKLMGLCMIALFAVLAPLSVFASTISGSFNALAKSLGDVPGLGLVFSIGGYLIGVLFAFVLFEVIYLVVPNVKIEWKDSWRGALFAAVLFEIINLVFPFYVKSQHSQFGAVAGLLAILTFWFWVVSLILLFGAEVNSFAALGQRAAGGDLPTVLHDVQVHGEVSRQGEDADAPPPGHPVSARGEREHARHRDEKAPTGEGAAHVPGDRDQVPAGQASGAERTTAASSSREGKPSAEPPLVPDRASQASGRPTGVGVADGRPASGRPGTARATAQGSRNGSTMVAMLAGLSALLALLHRGSRRT